jgi:GAF domain-containing protein
MAGKSARDDSGQLQALAQASTALTTELSLERVLQKIAEVARDVLEARYGALGMINENGTGLSQRPVSVLPEVLALRSKDISRAKPAVRACGLLDRCRA